MTAELFVNVELSIFTRDFSLTSKMPDIKFREVIPTNLDAEMSRFALWLAEMKGTRGAVICLKSHCVNLILVGIEP